MLSQSILAAATCLLTFSTASPTPVKRDCPTYAVYVQGTATDTTGTGNNPNPSDAVLASIASQAVPAATVTALAYPASGIVNSADYDTSWGIGIDHLQGLIKYYIDTCATTEVVLLGYSQGASVVSGALYGGQGRAQLADNLLAQVKGGVVFADPSFVAGLQPLDYAGAAASNGAEPNTDVNGSLQDPNPNLQAMFNTGKGTVFRSYCEVNDLYCASGNSGDIHGAEETTWEAEAVAFLQTVSL